MTLQRRYLRQSRRCARLYSAPREGAPTKNREGVVKGEICSPSLWKEYFVVNNDFERLKPDGPGTVSLLKVANLSERETTKITPFDQRYVVVVYKSM